MISFAFVSQFLVERIIRLIAVVLVASPIGCFRAWFAKYMGDPTAEEQGYMTLNPFKHIPLLGFVMLLFLPFGIINVIPINPNNYHEPYRRLKMGTVAFSGVASYFILAVIALACSILLYGPNITNDNGLSWAIIIILVQTCLFFAVLEFFMYSVLLIAMPLIEEQVLPAHYAYMALVVAPLILILAFGDTIQQILGYGITIVAQLIVRLIGGA